MTRFSASIRLRIVSGILSAGFLGACDGGSATAPERESSWKRPALARADQPRVGAEMFSMSGGSAISSSGSPPATRVVEFSAYTQCSACASGMTETGGEMRMSISSGGSSTNATNYFGQLGPYATGSYTMTVSGAAANASIMTLHTTRYSSQTYTTHSSANRTV